MATTPSQVVFVEEVQASTIGDQVPVPPIGSLALFSNQNDIWYAKNHAGTVVALSGVTSLTNSDGTITVTGTATAPIVSRAAITGDVSVPAGSNVSTLASTITAGGPTGSASVVPVVTYDAKGRLTAVTTATITPGAIGAVAGVAAADTSIVMGGTSTNPTVSRGHVISDIDIPAGSNTATLPTVNGNVGSFGDASHVATFTVNGKGLTTAASNTLITPAAIGAPSGSGSSTGTNTGDVTLTAVGAAPNANAATLAAQVLNLQPSSASFPGVMTAAQFTKLNSLVTGSTGWYDVTQYGLVANSSGAAAANVTAINTLLSSTAPQGSVIFFPPGTYFFNAAWNSGAALTRAFCFLGCYGQSNIAMTANIGATWITMDAASNDPTSFIGLSFFSSGVTQTAGAVIECGNSAQPQILFCQFSGGGGTFQLFGGVSMVGTNSGNGGNIDGCNFGQCNGIVMNFSGGQGSTVVSNTLVAGVTVSGRAIAGIQCTTSAGVSGGSVMIDNCDIIGCTNNLLLNPVTGTTLASIWVNQSFFDQSLGSGVLITGAGTVLRCRFQACWFTLATASSSANAVQTATTGTSIHGGIEFDNCWILNTPAGGGSPIGMNLAAIQDIGIRNCQVAGFTTGISVTPNASNNCALVIENCTIGPVGGVGANTTGIILGAGTYARQTIIGNDLVGNTTAITDNTTVTTTANNNRILQKNQGFNPKSAVATPAIPATTVAVFNSTGVDVCVYLKLVAAITSLVIGGVNTGITALTAAGVAIPCTLAANQSIVLTYASTAPTWVWIGT